MNKRPKHITSKQHSSYWVYENKIRNKAFVHTADCSSCNSGMGVHGGGQGNLDRWTSFGTCSEAFRYAKATGRKDVRGCKKCIPLENKMEITEELTTIPVLFLNMGWMTKYCGPNKKDPTRGNFGHLKKNIHGHECYNFMPKNRVCYGHHPGSMSTSIENLGASRADNYIDGILVIWMARDPRCNDTRIIGWYDNARVYRKFQFPKHGEGHKLQGDDIYYKIVAKEKDCHLLAPDQRQFHIPSSHEKKGGFGQNIMWYGLNDKFRKEVRDYVASNGKKVKTTSVRTKSPPRNNDPELRRKVEKIAVTHAWEYYESEEGGSRSLVSVELKAKGWDLEAQGNDDILLIEVKGLSGSSVAVELTPNEYKKMFSAKYRKQYVLYVVTNCLQKKPQRHIFRYMHDSKIWESEFGVPLEVKPRTGAVLSAAV